MSAVEQIQMTLQAQNNSIFVRGLKPVQPKLGTTTKTLKSSDLQSSASILVNKPVQHEHIITTSQHEHIDAYGCSFVPAAESSLSHSQFAKWAPEAAWARRIEWDDDVEVSGTWLRYPGIVKITDSMLFPAWLPADRWIVCMEGTMHVSIVEAGLMGLWPESALSIIQSLQKLHEPFILLQGCNDTIMQTACTSLSTCALSSACAMDLILAAAITAGTVRQEALHPGSALKIPPGYFALISSTAAARQVPPLAMTFLASNYGTEQAAEQIGSKLPEHLTRDWKRVMQAVVKSRSRLTESASSTSTTADGNISPPKGKERRKRWKRRTQNSQTATLAAKNNTKSLYAINMIHLHQRFAQWRLVPPLHNGQQMIVAPLSPNDEQATVRGNVAQQLNNKLFPTWVDMQSAIKVHHRHPSGQAGEYHVDTLKPNSWYGIWINASSPHTSPSAETPFILLTPPISTPGPPSQLIVTVSLASGIFSTSVTWGPPKNDGGSELLAYALSCTDTGNEKLGSAIVLNKNRTAYTFYTALEHGRTKCFLRAINEAGAGKPIHAPGQLTKASPDQGNTATELTATGALFAANAFIEEHWTLPTALLSQPRTLRSATPLGASTGVQTAISILLKMICNTLGSRACSRHEHVLKKSSDCEAVQSSLLIGGQPQLQPSFGPVLKIDTTQHSVTILEKLMPKTTKHLQLGYWLAPVNARIVTAQSIVARPLNLDVQASLAAQRRSNAADWTARIVVGVSSDVMQPAEQITMAAAQGALGLALIDFSGDCLARAGCWIHDFKAARRVAEQHHLHVVLLSEEQGRELLRMTSTEWLASHQ